MFTRTYCCKSFAVQCSDLEYPQAGNVTVQTDGMTTFAFFTCYHGYYILGTAVLECGINGVWNETEPECGGKVCIIKLVENLKITTKMSFLRVYLLK